jgi:hypothetical protein
MLNTRRSTPSAIKNEDMTQPDCGSAADSRPHDGPAASDLTKPFDAARTLIRRYAEDTDTPIDLDAQTGSRVAGTVSSGMAAAILAEIAASTGRVLAEWFPPRTPLDHLLFGLDSTTAQPGWSPVSQPALFAAKHVVADNVSSPACTIHQSIRSQHSTAQGEVRDQAEILDAGVMMCLELVGGARQIRVNGGR